MRKQARHQEWAQLRISGRPLLTGIALGPTPLFWVACRASPCLVHVFQDGVLQSIFRFQSDPSFLLLGDLNEEKGVDTAEVGKKTSTRSASLLVITADGSVFLLEIASKGPSSSGSRTSATGPNLVPNTSRHAKLGEHSKLPGEEWQLFEDNDVYDESICPVVENVHKQNLAEGISKGMQTGESWNAYKKTISRLLWANLKVSGYSMKTQFLTPTSVSADTLLGSLQAATVGLFGTSSSVIIMAQAGSPVLLQAGSPNAQYPDQLSTGLRQTASINREPTCLLFVSCARSSHSGGGKNMATLLSEALFTCLVGKGVEMMPSHLLIQGDDHGKVDIYAMPNLRLTRMTKRVLLDIEEPIVALLPLSSDSQDGQSAGFFGPDIMLVVGQSGTVVALTSTGQESSDSPFLPCKDAGREQGIQVTADVGVHKWSVKSPVSSACMLGSRHLCYRVGAEVFVAEIFELGSPSTTLSQTRIFGKQLRQRLLHKIVPIADRICAVAGNPGTGRALNGRPLVVLTTRGRLIGVEVLDEPASNAVDDRGPHVESSNSWAISQARTKEKVKNLLQAVADIARQTDAVRNHSRAINTAINELAASLYLTYDLSNRNIRSVVLSPTTLPGAEPSNKTPNTGWKGFYCTLQVNQFPSGIVSPEQLVSATPLTSKGTASSLSISPSIQVSVDLQNLSDYALSSYWTLILKFESVGPSCKPVAIYMSTVINNGEGLQAGSHFCHELQVELPGSYLSPVIVSIFLCHIHDYHELLVSNPAENGSAGCCTKVGTTFSSSAIVAARLGSGKIVKGGGLVPRGGADRTSQFPGAVSFLLCQYRVDVLSFLRAPPVGTSRSLTSTTMWNCTSEATTEDMRQDPDGGTNSSLSGSFNLDGFYLGNMSDVEVQNCWQKLHLGDLEQQGLVSKAGHQITLMAPRKEMVSLSIRKSQVANDSRKPPSLLYQATSSWLCCLLREALLWRLMQCEREDKPDNSPPIDQKRLKMHGGKLVGVLPGTAAEQRELDPKLEQRKNLVDVLGDRAEAVATQWKKIFADNTAESAELVTPVLIQTQEIVKDLVRTYKEHREEPASNPFGYDH